MSAGAVAPHAIKQTPGTPGRRQASDDEILGLVVETRPRVRTDADDDLTDTAEKGRSATENGPSSEEAEQSGRPAATLAEPEDLRAVLEANPELSKAWQDAQAYRETFATPAEARAASSALVDLDRLDALFFSGRPEQHAELARMVSKLDPKEFASLAREMATVAATIQSPRSPTANDGSAVEARANPTSPAENATNAGAHQNSAEGESLAPKQANATTVAQQEFFHSANASAVQSVIDAIETQVERVLPEGVSKSARGRLVREIYRDVEASLGSNRQLASQLREAFRSGSLDSNHERAVVSLITARAKQALPGITKRVFNEWSSTVLATHQERRARQRATERRVDIVGSSGAANDGRRSMTPRDIDYARMSDSDILNL